MSDFQFEPIDPLFVGKNVTLWGTTPYTIQENDPVMRAMQLWNAGIPENQIENYLTGNEAQIAHSVYHNTTAQNEATKDDSAFWQRGIIAGASVLGGAALAGGVGASTATATSTGASVVDISPDLLEVTGEGTNIFTSDPDVTQFFADNPDLVEGGGGVSPFGENSPTVPPTGSIVQNYPDLKTISTTAATALKLYAADRVAQAQVEQAKAANRPATTPTSMLPNFRSFLTNPGGLFSPGNTGGTGSLTNASVYVIAGVILLIGLLFLKGR